MEAKVDAGEKVVDVPEATARRAATSTADFMVTYGSEVARWRGLILAPYHPHVRAAVQCTVHSAQCTVHSVQCTVHRAQCTVHSQL